ncbi:MAG: hypothetical protein K9N23_00440 [Akkermansiaceae bacterium]|nr:hypothetical protein [Akkermansiaceae bacterium]MCF7730117.1 hypothetical protein [Akkermansiaceae bacterium]
MQVFEGDNEKTGGKQSFVETTPPADLPALSAGFDYRTFRMSNSVANLAAGFVRLTVAVP